MVYDPGALNAFAGRCGGQRPRACRRASGRFRRERCAAGRPDGPGALRRQLACRCLASEEPRRQLRRDRHARTGRRGARGRARRSGRAAQAQAGAERFRRSTERSERAGSTSVRAIHTATGFAIETALPIARANDHGRAHLCLSGRGCPIPMRRAAACARPCRWPAAPWSSARRGSLRRREHHQSSCSSSGCRPNCRLRSNVCAAKALPVAFVRTPLRGRSRRSSRRIGCC